MRILSLVLLVPFSCSVPADTWEPACIASGRVHACGPGPRGCTLMGVYGGWTAAFDRPADAAYEVEILADGEATSFRCEEQVAGDGGTYYGPIGDTGVWSCDLQGFSGGPTGDEIVATVTVDGREPATTAVEPCWDITEPNNRCCGFNYTAASTIAAYTD